MRTNITDINKRLVSNIEHKDAMGQTVSVGDAVAFCADPNSFARKMVYGMVVDATSDTLKIRSFDDIMNNEKFYIGRGIKGKDVIIINKNFDNIVLDTLRNKLKEKTIAYTHYVFAYQIDDQFYLEAVVSKNLNKIEEMKAARESLSSAAENVYILNSKMDFEQFSDAVKPYTKLVPAIISNNGKRHHLHFLYDGGIYVKENHLYSKNYHKEILLVNNLKTYYEKSQLFSNKFNIFFINNEDLYEKVDNIINLFKTFIKKELNNAN